MDFHPAPEKSEGLRTRDALGAIRQVKAACGVGFRGSLGEWERLMGAATRRYSVV